ncbi:MAG: trypco2 family protein [Catenulispora sp.]
MIELGSVIKDLRAELEEAIVAGADSALRFELGPIELEVSVALERSGGGQAKVRFWVMDLGADAKTDASSTQKVKLTLTPRLAGTGATPYIAGEVVPGER